MESRKALADLLSKNDVEQAAFDDLLLETLLVGIFEVAAENIESAGEKVKVLGMLRNAQDEGFVVSRILEQYANCSVPESLLPRMAALLSAYLKKDVSRTAIPEEQKQAMIKEQKGLCPICGCDISISNSHWDHIVAHKYVGDELIGNYQMLCESCNERKGASPYYMLAMKLCAKGGS